MLRRTSKLSVCVALSTLALTGAVAIAQDPTRVILLAHGHLCSRATDLATGFGEGTVT